MAVHGALLSLTYTLDNLMHNDKFPLINDDKGQQIIKHLHERISFLHSFLKEDARETTVDSSFKGRIRDAAYNAEDVIESHISDHVGKQADQLLRHEFEKVIEEIDLIVKEAKRMMTTIKKGSISIEEGEYDAYSFGGLSSLPAPKMVGLSDQELLKIKDWICGQSSRLGVISIVGMGGTGKTTLARNLLDDPLIAEHFDRRAWLTISQQYQKRSILLGLSYFLTENREGDLSQQSLQKTEEEILAMLEENVYKSLKGRRYLIVMDDMWSIEAWDDVRRILPDDGNGSRIIVTTRSLKVAASVDDSLGHVHQMQFLDGDQSWELLREKVFVQESCRKELEVIGRKIAGKCRGLPLAIVLIAGLLSNVPRRARDWENFAGNVSSKLATGEEERVSKIMSLSYNHLPHHLKPCFLYVGGFPEDYEISVFKLLQLWIAEGFVTKPSTVRCLEEVAEDYLDDLVSRNLVLITKKSSTGKSKKCRMHDMLREFCIHKAKYEKLFSIVFPGEGMTNKRRVFLHQSRPYLRSNEAATLRSLIVSASRFDMADLSSLSALLRVFEGLETLLLSSFPIELPHLRYLSFTLSLHSERNMFLASISRLRNLHTIIVHNHLSSSQPFKIWWMPQLRHLVVKKFFRLSSPTTIIAPGYGETSSCLQNLQTLSRILNYTFTEKSISLIPNLKKLGATYTNDVNWFEYGLHNLVHLHKLESLNLTINKWHVDIHENFCLPLNLRKLSVCGGGFPWEKMKVIGSLPNLEVLKLRWFAFLGDEWVTTDGEFPHLKFLLMDWIKLKNWRTESSHFPHLERLIIRSCDHLEEIPSAIGEIPTLQLIEVGSRRKNSVARSAMRIQEEQNEMGNDYLKVRILKDNRPLITMQERLLDYIGANSV